MRIDGSETYLDDETSLVFHGDLLEVASYREGLTDGPQREWYPGGQRRTEGTSRKSKAVGDWYEWQPNGTLAVHSSFDDNGRPPRVERWNAAGKPLEDG